MMKQPAQETAQQESETAFTHHTASLAEQKEKALQQLRDGVLNGWQMVSLLNDMHYAHIINEGLNDIVQNHYSELCLNTDDDEHFQAA